MVNSELRDKLEKAVPDGESYKIINVCLFGLTCYQVLSYYLRNSADRKSKKILFAILWMGEAIHVLTMPMMYDHLLWALDKPKPYSGIVWSLVIMFVAGTTMEFILRGFICRQIWKLGKISWQFVLVLIILATGTAVISTQIPDVLLSGTLCLLLTRQRENVVRLRRVSSIRRALAYIVNIGILPPLVLLLFVVAKKVAPGTQLALLYELVYRRIYLNAVLGALLTSWDDERLQRPGQSMRMSSLNSNVEGGQCAGRSEAN